MALIAIEQLENGIRWTMDGRRTATSSSLKAMLEQVAEPSVVVCEPEFYYDLRDVRRDLERTLAKSGHRLAPLGSAALSVLGLRAQPQATGHGVRQLFELASTGSDALERRSAWGVEQRHLREAVEIALLVDLYARGDMAIRQAVAAIGPYSSFDAGEQAALGDGSGFGAHVLLAAYRAASVATNRDDYERLLGLNAGGHGVLAESIRAWYVARNTTQVFQRESTLPWSDYRRALRSIFRRVKAGRQAAVAA